MDPNIDWKGIAGAFVGVVKLKIAGYLKDHKEAEQFIDDCGEQVAKLSLKQLIPGLTDIQKSDVAEEIEAYKKAMILEADSVLLDVEGAAKSTLLSVLETALDIVVKIAPEIAKLAL